jgi:hypothetical protein
LSVNEKPLPARKWPAQRRVKELTGKRTANSKVYQLSDGRLQAEISPAPLHYRDGKGAYQPIDTTVRPVNEGGYVQGNQTNTFTSLFGDRSDDLVRFERDGRSVEMGLAGAGRGVTPTVSGSTVTYPGLAGAADLVYDVTSTALKEKIVLRKAPAGPVSYTFTVDRAGLTAQQRPDGSIAFVRPSGGEPVFVMPAPFMYDSKDDASSPHGKVWSGKVSQRVQQLYGQTTVTVSADAGWWRRLIPRQIDDNTAIDALGDRRPAYAAIQQPMLLLGGQRSPRHLAERLDALAKVLPRAERVTLRGQGHGANLRAPDEVARVVAAFADRILR